MIEENRLKWHLEGPLQVYDHEDELQGWMDRDCRCPTCGHIWRAVAAVGAEGIQCPRCLECDPFYIWRIPPGAEDCRRAAGFH